MGLKPVGELGLLQFGPEVGLEARIKHKGSSERPHGMNHREIVLLSKYMSFEEALASATSVAGECLGINADKLKEGFIADIAVFGEVTTAEDLKPV
ncbi:hypothetical protein M164_0623 [Sulfolobus islandicus M.16.4]|uniref:Amidohydrolase-related domain-containing protein n=2 Tax=Saccharolobus islandicus TaxID=43080 RepID=C4KEP5_SACI6|nr:hypothetical protein M164_0623 [Sulfolobus islandicus M.16.4]